MPRGQTGHLVKYQWKPGESGRPGGTAGPKTHIRKVSKEWADELRHYIFNEPEHVFMEWLAEPHRAMSEKLMSKLIEKVYMTGDAMAFKILLEALLGKPKDEVVVSRGHDAAPTLGAMTDDELSRREALLVDTSL